MKNPFEFKIPDLIKKQIQLGIGEISVSYYPYVTINNKHSKVNLGIRVTFQLTYNDIDKGVDVKEDFIWSSATMDTSFEAYVNTLRHLYRFVGDD